MESFTIPIIRKDSRLLVFSKRFLKLPGGVPSHGTFERVFAGLDPRVFECYCLAWLRDVANLLGVGHIAIDGKTLCGSAARPSASF